MANSCRLAILTGSPYTMMLKFNSFRCKSDCCGTDYSYCDNPSPPPSPSSGSDNDSKPRISMYDCRKYSHGLPGYQYYCLPFESLPHLPCDIFRNTEGEELGPGAGKNRVYKNPEYFSFHQNTFYDMHLLLRMYRKTSAVTGRKPIMNSSNDLNFSSK